MTEQKLNSILDFFEDLDQADKNIVLSHCRKVKFNKGQSLINTADECVGLVIVKQGQLRAYTVGDDGKEITLYRMIENDTCIMSASCVLKEITFNISFSFERDSKILIIPADIFEKLNKKYAHVKEYTLNLVNSRFSDVLWVLEQYVFTNFATRLAHLLIEHSSLHDDGILMITHEELARDLGSAREVVTRMLRNFQDDNLVYLSRGKIEILDISELSRL